MSQVTMTRVAQAAGVSVSTVSHVINGTRPVAPATRRLVHGAIERLGFTHKPVARSLAAGSTTTIGASLSLVSSLYGQELIAGIEEESLRQGMQLLLCDTRDDPEREERVIANLMAHHISGLILAPTPDWEHSALRLLRERAIPFVVVDRLQDLAVDQVGVENESGSAALVEHLLQRGHRRIGLVAGMAGLSTTRERIAGYRMAHQRRSIPIDEELIVDGRSTDHGGRRAMGRLLQLPDRPTAAFVANDVMVIGALRALQSAGLQIPGDMALVCFDEFPWADVFAPRLTTVVQPSFAIGARAVQLLVRRLADPSLPHQVLRFNGEIVHRDSCGCRVAAQT